MNSNDIVCSAWEHAAVLSARSSINDTWRTQRNLQNLPAGSDYGKDIKYVFCPPENKLWLYSDFNSLEDYISALLSKDPNKLKVYAGSKQFIVTINGVDHTILEDDVVNFNGDQLTGKELYAKLHNCKPSDVHDL